MATHDRSLQSSARLPRALLPALPLLFFLLTGSALASPADFPKPAGLEPQVQFWKKIFSKYSEDECVFHDNARLDKVYSVVSLPSVPEGGGPAETEARRERKARVDDETERLTRILLKLDREGAVALDEDERAVWKLFADDPDPNRFRTALDRLRSQTGLKERFRRGIEISRRYLPFMEEKFRSYGLPVELTRLPLVESTFNVKAYSKVGAAGVWQFMPSSARLYGMRVDQAIDERRDPLAATDGAARHLRDDYEMLGAWPLALTAYNHGRAGVAKAVREVGSTNIVDLIRDYHGTSFGFASRNFYAEFLAAMEVERDRDKYFPDLRYEPVFRYDTATLEDYVPFSTLVRICDCGEEALLDMNLSILSEVTEGSLHVPAGTTLRLPPGRGPAFRTALASLPSDERFAQQKTRYVLHRVGRGQSLGWIARHYGVTMSSIQAANGLRSRTVKRGQTLRVPRNPSRVMVARADAPSRSVARSVKGSSKVVVAVRHRVQKGQSLGSIAKRYGTSVQAIRAHNGMGANSVIKAGQVLRIPPRRAGRAAEVS